MLNGRPISVLTVALGPEFWEQAWVACDLPHSGPRRAEALQAFAIRFSRQERHDG